jgi:phosphoribosylamine--glycine ligase
MAKALVIGGGGREHALVKALVDDADVEHVYCAPGNGGTAAMENVTNVPLKDPRDLVAFADREEIDLTVVGPEQPLVEGVVDFFRQHDLRVFGFGKAAARLEGSKAFAKRFMQKYAIPTAPFWVFEHHRAALRFLRQQFAEDPNRKYFIKADELCAGKGAFPTPDLKVAEEALRKLLEEKSCGVGKLVVVEEALRGQEASLLGFTDGKAVATMPPAQDHKRAYDDDEGPNTGGMGAYAPAPLVTERVYARIEQEIILPTLLGMEEERLTDGGVLYFGLMIDPKGKPYVLEYNVRFGDPEAQSILALLESDLYPVLQACVDGRLHQAELRWREGAAVCVVIAVEGYPERYDHQDEEIHGLEEAEALEDVIVYHAGTDYHNGKFYTKGGRVLGVTGLGPDVASARERAYEAVSKIHFQGMRYRRDIASKALPR